MNGLTLLDPSADLMLPSIVHPRTGEPVYPLAVKRDGSYLWPVMGAAEEDDDSDSDDDDDTDSDNDDDSDSDGDGKDDEYKPPTKEAFRAMQRQLQRRGAEIKRLKSAARTKAEDDGKTKSEVEKAVVEAEKRGTERAVNAEAKAVLVAAGLILPEGRDERAKAVRRAIKLIDLDDIDPDDLEDSLTDAVDELKDLYPSMFGKAGGNGATRRRTGGDGGKGGDGKESKDTSSDAKIHRALNAAIGH